MKPYFQNEAAGVTLYHGDCKEILPTLPKFDLVLTDPPYGINAARTRNSQKDGWRDYGCDGWDLEKPAPEIFHAMLTAAPVQIIWGGNYFTDVLPPSMQWLVWDKGQRDFSLADCEFAWSSQKRAARIFTYSRSLALQDGKQHPTQKPLALIEWCIQQAPPNIKTIVDFFNGSGTTGVACIRLSRQYTGIEIEERYCEISAQRFEREIAQGKLFDANDLRAAEAQPAIPWG